MSGQTQYFDNVTREYFVWNPARGVFVNCRTSQAVSQNNSEYGRFVAVTPRTVAPQPATSDAPYTTGTNLGTAPSSSYSYTRERRQTASSTNESNRVTSFTSAQPGSQGFWPSQQTTASNTASSYGQQLQQYSASEAPTITSNLPTRPFPIDRGPSGSTFDVSLSGTFTNIAYAERGRQTATNPSIGHVLTSSGSVDQSGTSSGYPRGAIPERREGYDSLDERFKVRKHGFYKPGRVFMMNWSEPASNETVTSESLSQDPRFGTNIHSKIRRFIVVWTGDRNNYSNCVRIITYEGRGLAKSGVNHSEHAIAYCGNSPPDLLRNEILAGAKSVIRPPVRIQPDETGDKLSEKSRIDYGRIYPVEHNLPARSVGLIHESSRREFFYTFRTLHNSNADHSQALHHEATSGNVGASSRRPQNINPSVQRPTYPQLPQSNSPMNTQQQVSYSAYQTDLQNQTRLPNQRQTQPQRGRISASHYRTPSYRARPRDEVSENESDED